ncbi:MAG: hypothetical protein FRX49_03126 [Trebouxia sp. A1-2]|nr:MAG: hypothetical protein FRX49_03126 [Trebouxia sp. A1-2]
MGAGQKGGGGLQGASQTSEWLPINQKCGMGQQLAAIEGSRGPGSQGGQRLWEFLGMVLWKIAEESDVNVIHQYN